MTPQDLKDVMSSGLLSFPVTPFDRNNGFDAERYRSNLDWLCGYDVAGLFPAGTA